MSACTLLFPNNILTTLLTTFNVF